MPQTPFIGCGEAAVVFCEAEKTNANNLAFYLVGLGSKTTRETVSIEAGVIHAIVASFDTKEIKKEVL